jgi:hypothetical protein
MSMKIVTYLTGLAMLLAASVLVSPAIYAAESPASSEVSDLLTQAKSHVIQLKHDAEEMESFTRSQMDWRTHATQLAQIKEHANNLGEVVQKLNDARSTAAPWQQEAMDRINPVLQELASNIESTIDHVNKNQERTHMPAFKDYVKANYELASEAAALVSDFVTYGETKAKFQKLGRALEVSD